MLTLRKSTVRSAPGNGDRRAQSDQSDLRPGRGASRRNEVAQQLADSALQQVANCYKHQAHALINTYFSQRQDLAVYHELTSRVMALQAHRFSLDKDGAGGDIDVASLARLCDSDAGFMAEIARGVLESQLLRLENGDRAGLQEDRAVQLPQSLQPAQLRQPAQPLEERHLQHLQQFRQPLQAMVDLARPDGQPDLGEIDKLIQQILAMEVPVSTFPSTRSGGAD